MQTMQHRPPVEAVKQAGRRFGYALSIGINLVVLWIVFNILEWGWPPFVTEDWTRAQGLVAASIIVAIIANVAYIAYDPKWFRGFGDAFQSVFTMVSSARVLAVFPFDYTPYSGPWEVLTRIILIVAIVGSAIAIIINLAKGSRKL